MPPPIAVTVPWYYITMGYVLGAILFSLVNPPRFRFRWRLLIWFALPGCVALLTLAIGVRVLRLPLPLQLATLAFAYATLILTCRIPWCNALYFTFLCLPMGELFSHFPYLICLLLSWKTTQKTIQPRMLVIYFLFATLICLLLYLFERKNLVYNAKNRIRGINLAAILLAVLAVYTISNFGIWYYPPPFTARTATFINVIHCLVDLIGVMLLEAHRNLRIDTAQARERAAVQRLSEQQYEAFRISERSIELINQKYHDMKHHLAMLRAQSNDQDRQAYLDELEQAMQPIQALCQTGNRVLDTLLITKNIQCQEKQIRMTCIADGRLLDFMRPVDQTALLGNLLDNAIEAVEKLSNPERRWIQISLRRKYTFVILETVNGYDGALRFVDGLPVSTKKEDHGYGTKSIRQTAAQYGGEATFHAEDGWFTAKVVFSRPDMPQSEIPLYNSEDQTRRQSR